MQQDIFREKGNFESNPNCIHSVQKDSVTIGTTNNAAEHHMELLQARKHNEKS